MEVEVDVRSMIEESGEPVALASGRIVTARPGVASAQGDLGGDSIIAGRTRTLLFVTADVADLKQGELLNWNEKAWRVVQLGLLAKGAATKAFLGAP